MRRALMLLVVVVFALSAITVYAAVGGGDLTFKPKGAKPVFFSHVVHVDGKTYKCSACHYNVFQMEKNSYKMEMSKINKGDFCGKCHNGERSFDVKEAASCVKCHK